LFEEVIVSIDIVEKTIFVRECLLFDVHLVVDLQSVDTSMIEHDVIDISVLMFDVVFEIKNGLEPNLLRIVSKCFVSDH
jgi:hypothetical protein